jgi:cell wall-associated NlpC family hydrolase
MSISRPAAARRKHARLAAVAAFAALVGLCMEPASAQRAAAAAPAAASSADPQAIAAAEDAPRGTALPDDALTRLLRDRGLIAKDGGKDTPPTAEVAPPKGLRERVSDAASDLVITSMNFLGVPYRRGGQSDAGFDCSGFTRYIFEHSVGLVLPRRAEEQARAPGLKTVARDELKPGDLVFFNTLRRTFSHVGIYIGDNKFIHSPRAGGEVRMEDMRVSYWTKRYNGARRALDGSSDSSRVAPAATVPAATAPPPSANTLVPADPSGF